tara:strand:+ start:8554 stop:8871 length:318 start_codon:yes stop_codon:yes gene_type:complete
MADKSEFKNMSWFQRAIDKSMPTTEANETVRTGSFDLEDGTIVLVPTIRMVNGKLVKVEKPVQDAIDNGDFLTGFKDHEEATKFSKMISSLIGMKRNENKALTND